MFRKKQSELRRLSDSKPLLPLNILQPGRILESWRPTWDSSLQLHHQAPLFLIIFQAGGEWQSGGRGIRGIETVRRQKQSEGRGSQGAEAVGIEAVRGQTQRIEAARRQRQSGGRGSQRAEAVVG